MDIMGYKSYWSEAVGDIPKRRLNVRSHVWDMTLGEHFFTNFKHKDVICRKVKNIDIVDESVADSIFAVTPAGDVNGHMTVATDTIAYLNNTDKEVPIMPNYVRDLAGRVICIAECFPLQKESAKSKRFPVGSFVVDETVDSSGLLENIFFSNFRTLDMSKTESDNMSGYVGTDVFYSYPNANLHPYKLRVDTFYQDGWRIPQTEMLYAHKPTEDSNLDFLVKEFDEKWDNFTNKYDYEAFYEHCGGEEYFNSLFEKGLTLIPTLEGYNANPIVDRDFNLVDFHHGKYVAEFHDLVEYVDSELPSGTIVNVVEPGYMTTLMLKKARVVVSNGALYQTQHEQDPNPLYPDLRLPHQRTSSKWGDVHVPTHPEHFEHAAIWGWDSKTGMFLQEKGPIWDPLHYYYESTDKIIDAYQGDVVDDNYWFYEVPEEMKMRFYPVVPLEGFDLFDNFEKEDRYEHMARPYTYCKRYTEEVFSVNVGYHPMPIAFEYELDSWFAPELSPVKRVLTDVPLNLRESLMPVIQCNVPAKLYLKKQAESSDKVAYWTEDLNSMADSVGEFKRDYQYLLRYTDNITAINRVKELYKVYLVYPFNINTDMLKSEYLSTVEVPKSIDESIRDMSLAYYDLKDKSFERVKNKHKLFVEMYDEYIMASWNSSDSNDLTYMLKDDSVAKLEQSHFSSVAIMQPPTF